MIRKALIPAAAVVLALLAAIIIESLPNEEKEVGRIQEILAERYGTSFVYEGKDTKEIPYVRVKTLGTSYTSIQGEKTLYYFHPSDNDDLSFYAIHGTELTEVVPFPEEYCYDNFKRALFEDSIKSYG